MDVPTGPLTTAVTHTYGTIYSLRRLPQGKYLVTDKPELSGRKQFGHVTITKAWFASKHYYTEFKASSVEGGDQWQGDLEIKHDYMCEGSFRYLNNFSCGYHRVFLLHNGVLKVHVILDDGKHDAVLYWVKV